MADDQSPGTGTGKKLKAVKYKKIPRKDLVFEEGDNFFERGQFGDVKRAKWNNQEVAVKCFSFADRKGGFYEELVNLSQLQGHESIVKMHGASIGDHPFIVLEFAPLSLEKVIHECKKEYHYISDHVISWSHQSSVGLDYIHEKNILHRDIKPSNVLLFDKGRVLKLCDFGTAKKLEHTLTNAVGTIRYMAPEVIRGRYYTDRCDVFSFGMMVWEMLARRRPMLLGTRRGNNMAILYAMANGDRPPRLSNMPKAVAEMIDHCWDEEPHRRPTMSEIKLKLERLCKYIEVGKPLITRRKRRAAPPTDSEGGQGKARLDVPVLEEDLSSPGISLSSATGPESSESQTTPSNGTTSEQSQDQVAKETYPPTSTAQSPSLGRHSVSDSQIATVAQPSSAPRDQLSLTMGGQVSLRTHPSSIVPPNSTRGHVFLDSQPTMSQSPLRIQGPSVVDQPTNAGDPRTVTQSHLVQGQEQSPVRGQVPSGYQTPVSGQPSRAPAAVSQFQQQGQYGGGGHMAQPVERQQGYAAQQGGYEQQEQSRVNDDQSLAQSISSMQLGNLPPDQAQYYSDDYRYRSMTGVIPSKKTPEPVKKQFSTPTGSSQNQQLGHQQDHAFATPTSGALRYPMMPTNGPSPTHFPHQYQHTHNPDWLRRQYSFQSKFPRVAASSRYYLQNMDPELQPIAPKENNPNSMQLYREFKVIADEVARTMGQQSKLKQEAASLEKEIREDEERLKVKDGVLKEFHEKSSEKDELMRQLKFLQDTLNQLRQVSSH